MSKEPKDERKNERQYWLWVTEPEYYLDGEDHERSRLDLTGGWWTCHKDTRRGDLALLWRSRRLASSEVKKRIGTKSDIGYLFQARSDAYSTDEEDVASKGWNYSCDSICNYKFKNPVTLTDIRNNPHLDDWNALKRKFQGSSFKFSGEDWNRLNKMLKVKNPSYGKIIDRIEKVSFTMRVDVEEKIERKIAESPEMLKPFGYHLELYKKEGITETGKQVVCLGAEGRIDLLCYDKKRKVYVVIEIKNVKAYDRTLGQISKYIGWVKNRIAGRVPVEGLVLSRGADKGFTFGMEAMKRVSQLDIGKLGFR